MALKIRVLEREELDAIADAAGRICDFCELCPCCACCMCCTGAAAGTVTLPELVHAPAAPLED